VLDVVFRDDFAHLQTGHGPQNMAVVKHFTVTLVHATKPITSLKNHRKLAG
jgi:predicted transposase YbfD/YdcC